MKVNKTAKFGVFGDSGALDNQTAHLPKSIAKPNTSKVDSKASSAAAGLEAEQLILNTLSTNQEIKDSWEFAIENNIDHQVVVGGIKSLLPDDYVKDEMLTTSYYELTEEGNEILENGSAEFQVFTAVKLSEGGHISVIDLNKKLGEVSKIGLGPCLKNKWLKKDGENVVKLLDSIVDEVRVMLSNVKSKGNVLSEDDFKNLKRRKLVQMITRKSYRITKGGSFQPSRVKRMADLTKDMLGSIEEVAQGSVHWSQLAFRPVNLNSMGAPISGGNFHPLLKVRAEFRRILMDMGFEEMPTNKWVEGSFWNFDSLFQPQSHPARDAHDTFFIKEPQLTNFSLLPSDYYDRVKNIHEKGGHGSIGYGCIFKKDESMKNLLRTHTTAISAQMLYRLANQPGGFTPQKYFSIDRVFRNEAMDATHLCEFHQVEGLVADRNLTLGNLIALIRTFFEKIGITQIRFKPAYNPYTEPSMEVFGYHPELKKWTELGNSGMFRPEMLLPMGLPPDVRVIAWGLSLERPTMIKYRIENIRDLFGHKADLLRQRNAPMARF